MRQMWAGAAHRGGVVPLVRPQAGPQHVRPPPEQRHRLHLPPGSGYIALKIIGHEIRPDGTRRRITKSKSGLRTRKEAEEWLHSPEVQDAGGKRRTAYTFQQLYDLWAHPQAVPSTMNCYRAALKHLAPSGP